jgi:hypothetical protein
VVERTIETGRYYSAAGEDSDSGCGSEPEPVAFAAGGAAIVETERALELADCTADETLSVDTPFVLPSMREAYSRLLQPVSVRGGEREGRK